MKKTFLTSSFLMLLVLLMASNAIEVRTAIPGVKVYLNNSYKGETQAFGNINILRIDKLTQGKYTLRCTYENYNPYIQEISISASQPVQVINVDFAETRPKVEDLTSSEKGAQMRQTGIIVVQSIPTGASVKVNSINAVADCRLTDVPVGNCNVEVSFPSRSNLKTSFDLPAGKIVTVVADFFKNTITTDVKYTVTISSSPSSNLFIDGKLIGTTPLTRDLTSGNYEIELKKDGYQPVKQTIRVIRNDFLDFTLSPLGKLNINVWQEDARVFVNNQRIDDLKKDISLPVGNATVRIEASKAFTESFSVPIQANSTTFLEVSLITDLDAIERMNILKRSYKTWEDFYDKTQEKQLVKIERGAHDSIVQTVVILVGGVFVAVSDLVISPVIIASLILGKPLFGGEPDPNAEYYAAATGKKFYSILHMIFDPNSFTKVVKKRYPDAQHNNMLKTTASQRASEHNQVINERISSIQKGLQNSFVRYRINNGAVVNITPAAHKL